MKKNLLLKIGLVFECLMTLAWFFYGTLGYLGCMMFLSYDQKMGFDTPEESLRNFLIITLVYIFISFVFIMSIILTTKLVQNKEIAKISQILLPFMVIGEIWLTIWIYIQFFK